LALALGPLVQYGVVRRPREYGGNEGALQ
jgi:hypothetical protein